MVFTILSEHLLPMNCVFCLAVDATGVFPGAADRKAGERAVLLEVSLGRTHSDNPGSEYRLSPVNLRPSKGAYGINQNQVIIIIIMC